VRGSLKKYQSKEGGKRHLKPDKGFVLTWGERVRTAIGKERFKPPEKMLIGAGVGRLPAK